MKVCTRIVPDKRGANQFKDLTTKHNFKVLNIADGIVYIESAPGDDLFTVYHIATYAFHPSSNFKKVVFSVNELPENSPMNEIKFSFNGVEISINAKREKFEKIWNFYSEKLGEQ